MFNAVLIRRSGTPLALAAAFIALIATAVALTASTADAEELPIEWSSCWATPDGEVLVADIEAPSDASVHLRKYDRWVRDVGYGSNTILLTEDLGDEHGWMIRVRQAGVVADVPCDVDLDDEAALVCEVFGREGERGGHISWQVIGVPLNEITSNIRLDGKWLMAGGWEMWEPLEEIDADGEYVVRVRYDGQVHDLPCVINTLPYADQVWCTMSIEPNGDVYAFTEVSFEAHDRVSSSTSIRTDGGWLATVRTADDFQLVPGVTGADLGNETLMRYRMDGHIVDVPCSVFDYSNI